MDSNPYWALELEMTGRDSSSVASWHPNPCPGVFYSIQGWPMRCICTCSPSFMAGEMEDSTQQNIRQVSGPGTAVSSWTNPWARPRDGSSYTVPHNLTRPESHPHPPLDEQRHPRPTAQHPTASTHPTPAPIILTASSNDSSIYLPTQPLQPELSPEEFDLQLKQWFDDLNEQTTIYTPAPTTVNPTSTLLSKEGLKPASASFPAIHHPPQEIERPTIPTASSSHDTEPQVVEQTDDELARILQSKPTKLTHNSPGWLASPARPERSTKTPTARSSAASTVNETSPLQHRSTFRGHAIQGGSIGSLSYLKGQGQNAESSSSSSRVDVNRGKDFAQQLVAGPSTRSRSMNESSSTANAPSDTDVPSQSNTAVETTSSVQSGPSLAAWQTAYQTLASQGLLPGQEPLPSALAPPAHILSSNYPEFIIDPTNSAEPVQVKPPSAASSGPTQGRTAQQIYTSPSAQSTTRTTRPTLSLAPVNRDREGLVVVELAQHFSPARLRPEDPFYPTSAAGSGFNDAVRQGGWPMSDTGGLLPFNPSAGSVAPPGGQGAVGGLRGGHPMAMYQGFDPSDPWGIAAAHGHHVNNAAHAERSDTGDGAERGREEGPLDIATMIFGATTTATTAPAPPARGST